MPSSEFRARARETLKGKWFIVGLSVFIYMMITELLMGTVILVGVLLALGVATKTIGDSAIDKFLLELSKDFNSQLKGVNDGKEYVEVITRFIKTTAQAVEKLIPVLAVGLLIAIVLYAVVGSMLAAGVYKQYYTAVTDDEVSIGGLFKNISVWPKMFVIIICKYSLFVAVMAVNIAAIFQKDIIIATFFNIANLILVVLYLVLTLAWEFAPFVLIEEPELSGIKCLKKSAQITRGHKFKIFALQFTFLGWAILGGFVAVILSNIIPIAQSIVNAFIQVYLWTANVHYYMYITGQDAMLFKSVDSVYTQYPNGLNMNQDIGMNYDMNQGMGINQNISQGMDMNNNMNQGMGINQNLAQDIDMNNNNINQGMDDMIELDDLTLDAGLDSDLSLDNTELNEGADDTDLSSDSVFSGSIFEDDNI